MQASMKGVGFAVSMALSLLACSAPTDTRMPVGPTQITEATFSYSKTTRRADLRVTAATGEGHPAPVLCTGSVGDYWVRDSAQGHLELSIGPIWPPSDTGYTAVMYCWPNFTQFGDPESLTLVDLGGVDEPPAIDSFAVLRYGPGILRYHVAVSDDWGFSSIEVSVTATASCPCPVTFTLIRDSHWGAFATDGTTTFDSPNVYMYVRARDDVGQVVERWIGPYPWTP